MVSWPLAFGGVLPLFGRFVSGMPGTALVLCLAVLWFWLGYMWYRLKGAGWWILLASLVVLGTSSVMTFSHIEMTELYQKMGYPEAQIDLIRRQGWLSGRLMLWNTILWFVPVLGYLVWAKGFFRSRSADPVAPG
jgi:hypothetical protein